MNGAFQYFPPVAGGSATPPGNTVMRTLVFQGSFPLEQYSNQFVSPGILEVNVGNFNSNNVWGVEGIAVVPSGNYTATFYLNASTDTLGNARSVIIADIVAGTTHKYPHIQGVGIYGPVPLMWGAIPVLGVQGIGYEVFLEDKGPTFPSRFVNAAFTSWYEEA